MIRSPVTAVCWWLWFCAFHAPPSSSLSATGSLLHRRLVDPLEIALQNRARVLMGSQQQQQQQRRTDRPSPAEGHAVAGAGQLSGQFGGQPTGDQDTSGTIGLNVGLGFGLDSPLIDTLLERLLRRKQLLLAAAAASGYAGLGAGFAGVGPGWLAAAAGGAGYYPGPALYPYAGGGVGGGGIGGPWNRPAVYPYSPYVPPINPYGGGGGGWGPYGGGYNPVYDYDNDFAWKNNNSNQNN